MNPSAAKSTVCLLTFAALALGGCVNDNAAAAKPTTGDEARTVEFDLWVKQDFAFSPLTGMEFEGFAFALSQAGPYSVPGPELRVREGDHVVVHLRDPAGTLGHTLHWHGISVPWAMDGVPFMTQTVSDAGFGQTYTYEFDAKETGTYWYHCHVDAPVHVDLGLFGAIIVEPADPAQDLPFSRDYTMLLHEMDTTQSWTFDAVFSGTPPSPEELPSNPLDAAEAATGGARLVVDLVASGAGGTLGHEQQVGYVGPRPYYPISSTSYRPLYDMFMINGKAFPETTPLEISDGETIRIRLINAGQLLHTMHLHGHHFLITHKDGYNLPTPYWGDSLVIGPGERYDVYVTGNNPGMWDFHDHGGGWSAGSYAATDHAFPGGMSTMLHYEGFDLPLPDPVPMQAPRDEQRTLPAQVGHHR